MTKTYYVYIMSSFTRVIYTGVTGDLLQRVYQHRNKLVSGFTSRYHCTRLVYFEGSSDVYEAIKHEKEIKGWVRRKKIELIESANPDWKDLSEGWY